MMSSIISWFGISSMVMIPIFTLLSCAVQMKLSRYRPNVEAVCVWMGRKRLWLSPDKTEWLCPLGSAGPVTLCGPNSYTIHGERLLPSVLLGWQIQI